MAYSIEDNYETSITSGIAILSTWERVQTFTASSSYTATAISVKCWVLSQPGTFSGGIYDVDGNSKPTGSALATFSITVTVESGSASWLAPVALSSNISLTSGIEYALVIEGITDETFYWMTDDNVGSDGYANGEPFVDIGAGWVVRHSPNNWSDHSFRIYSGKPFTPPSTGPDITKVKYLVAAANSKIWYESI